MHNNHKEEVEKHIEERDKLVMMKDGKYESSDLKKTYTSVEDFVGRFFKSYEPMSEEEKIMKAEIAAFWRERMYEQQKEKDELIKHQNDIETTDSNEQISNNEQLPIVESQSNAHRGGWLSCMLL